MAVDYIGTAAQATANNKVLRRGYIGVTSDTGVMKVGDGVTAWNSLPSVGGGGGGFTQEQIEDFVGAMVTGNTETGIAVTYDDTAGKLNFVAAVTSDPIIPTFTYSGTAAVATGTARWYNDTGRTLTVSSVRASAGTAPTGSALTVDVRKNGTTMFTGGTDRPSIAAGTNTDTGVPAVTSIAAGDYLTVDIVAVGSTVAGADLTVQVVTA